MWAVINKWLDRIESRIALWQLVRVGGIAGGGVVTGALSSTVAWINQFGFFGWWVCFLGGCVLTAAAMALFQLVKIRRIQAAAFTKWSEQVDNFNPLDSEFHKKRIAIQDLKHPVKRNIEGKTFTDCELIGPANILFRKDCYISRVAFGDVDFVLLKDIAPIVNVIVFDSVKFYGGSIMNTTIFIHPANLDMIKASTPGIVFVNLTGDPEIDRRLPPGMGMR